MGFSKEPTQEVHVLDQGTGFCTQAIEAVIR